MSVLAQRVMTAVVMFGFVVCAVFLLPPRNFALVWLAVVLVAGHEWAKLAGLPRGASVAFMAALAIVAIALLYAPGAGFANGWPPAMLVAVCGSATLFWLLVAPPWVIARWPVRSRLLMALIGVLTLSGFWMAGVQLQARSPWILLGAMALVWTADTAAFFAGRAFGRHKLAPLVSPGKTWEGVAGALVGVAVYAAACAWFIGGDSADGAMPRARALASFVGIALLLAAVSIIGDLYESWLKRCAGVKDSGRLLPGHGGVLDRIDAMLAAMPATALAIGAWEFVR